MDKLLMLNILLSQFNYEYNSEYKNLSDEEKKYIDYVDECLKETDEKFSDACTKAMLFILDASNRLGTDKELTNEEATKEKEDVLNGFNQEDKNRLELFMYACIQVMGIYSEERITERKMAKEKSLVKKFEYNNDYKG